MTRVFFISVCLSCATFFTETSHALNIVSSVWTGIGEGAHGDTGTLVIGVNSATKSLSGYYESNDITGNVTAECKFFFVGQTRDNAFESIRISSAHPDFIDEKYKPVEGRIEVQSISGKLVLTIYPSRLPASCDWLFSGLPSYKPPKDFKLSDGLTHEFERTGDWGAVGIIRATRTHFYRQPVEGEKNKAFLVRGDLIYIHEENPYWYYVKYQGEGKETVGWIKKTDTIQLPNGR